MRPDLFWGGVIVLLAGVGFYFILFLDVSFPLAIGGAIMIAVSFFLPEGPGPIPPPAGFRFCVFCATPVPLSSNRCPRCNGLQPRES